MSDLASAIIAKYDAEHENAYWLCRDLLERLLAEHGDGEGHTCPAELEGYTVLRWHNAADPCPTVRTIAEKLGVEADGA